MVGRPAARVLRVADQAAGAEVGERVLALERTEAGDAPSAHRHHDVLARFDMAHVAAEVVVQLPDADFRLEVRRM